MVHNQISPKWVYCLEALSSRSDCKAISLWFNLPRASLSNPLKSFSERLISIPLLYGNLEFKERERERETLSLFLDLDYCATANEITPVCSADPSRISIIRLNSSLLYKNFRKMLQRAGLISKHAFYSMLVIQSRARTTFNPFTSISLRVRIFFWMVVQMQAQH